MTMFRRFALSALLAAGLAACGSGDATDEATVASEALAPVPAPEGQAWTEVAAETPEGGFRIGNPDAPLKLVEYASHTCPHCAEFEAEAGEPLKTKYVDSGVVSYELRNQIHDAIDLSIARLARCNGDPASFIPLAEQVWQNFDTVMAPIRTNPDLYQQAMAMPENQRIPTLAEKMGLIDFFAARGIARDQQMQCLGDMDSLTALSQQSQRNSDNDSVTGTPTFFLNGRLIDLKNGSTVWEQVEAALQNAGAR